MNQNFSRVYVDYVLDPSYQNWKRFFHADSISVHKAHLVMLVEKGIVRKATAAKIKAFMADIESESHAESEVGSHAESRAPFPDRIPEGMEDFYCAYEAELARHGAAEAAFLHTARSRNDMDTTIFRLALKRELLDLSRQLMGMANAILERARAGESEITVLYTHGQPANVSTMAHYLTGFLLDLLEGMERLIEAVKSTDQCPLGACAITGTGFPIDRDRTSHLLGFSAPVPNTYQAISTSHWLTFPAQALQLILVDVGRLAADLLHKASTEVGLVIFPDELVQRSSIMPQKRNAVILEHLRIQAALGAGACDSVVQLFRNTPYQDVNEVADAPVSQFLDSLTRVRGCAALFKEALSKMTSDPARARAIALSCGVTTTELADTIARASGVGFRSAHRACAAFVNAGFDKATLRKTFREVAGTDMSLSDQEIDQALSPERFVAVRQTSGGPAPGGMVAVYMAVRSAMARIDDALALMAERGRSAAAELDAAWSAL